jgi:hypothetical protein
MAQLLRNSQGFANGANRGTGLTGSGPNSDLESTPATVLL